MKKNGYIENWYVDTNVDKSSVDGRELIKNFVWDGKVSI